MSVTSISRGFLKIHIARASISRFSYLPEVLKTGLPEILSQVQHIAGNLSKLNLLKALIISGNSRKFAVAPVGPANIF